MQAAFTATTDARIVQAFHSPQAVVDPGTQAQLQQLLSELGTQAEAEIHHLIDVAHAALIAGVRLGYVMSLVLALIIMGLLIFIRTPDFRSAEQRVELPKHEGAVEII
jgi:hypothetical protein